MVDLFAGAGGVGLGLSWAGHEVVASVDNNADACRTVAGSHDGDHLVLERDLSDDEQFDDMVQRVKVRLGGQSLGVLTGGPPCQGFSTAGPCRVDDPRNRLVLSFLRAVVELEPEQVVFENVVALRWRGQAFLDELTERLGALGYDVGVRIMHAEAYGVPQLRRRLVLMATRHPGGVSWPQPTHAMSKPNFPKDQPGVHLEAPLPAPCATRSPTSRWPRAGTSTTTSRCCRRTRSTPGGLASCCSTRSCRCTGRRKWPQQGASAATDGRGSRSPRERPTRRHEPGGRNGRERTRRGLRGRS